LTEKLLESGANVIAVELEREMIAVLKEKFGESENFELVENDALKIDFAQKINRKSKIESPKSAKLVANLPYNISTAILQKLLEQRAAFSEMILMFQREVVERITAQVGNKERGFLTVLTERYLAAEKLFDVPPNAFLPAPKVWSAVVRLITKDGVENQLKNEKLFRQLISAGFAQKRKTILNNLKNAAGDLREKIGDAALLLQKSGVETNRRAESLTLEEWERILEAALNKNTN
jgi:16S rRNA (adenine1518-N6/adenine1519-N6)-dimethyltransferase